MKTDTNTSNIKRLNTMKDYSLVRIDRNIGDFAHQLPAKSGALEKITRDIIYYIAKNAGSISYNAFGEFKWNTADYLRTVNTSRSKLVQSWETALKDEEINYLFTKYDDPREREGYEWVKSKLDLAFYILSQVNLSYSEKVSSNLSIANSFIIFDSISIYTGKKNKKSYICSVNEKFLDRCLKSAYFNLIDYPKVPQKHRSIHLYLNNLRDKAYYLGYLQSKHLPLDDIAKVKGVQIDGKPKTRKQTLKRSLNAYIKSDSDYNVSISNFEFVDKDGKKDKEGYYIKFYFTLNSKARNSPFRYDKNEKFRKDVYTKLEDLYQLFYKEKSSKWDEHLIPVFDQWMKIGPEDTFFKTKIKIFSEGFKKHFGRDLKDFSTIYKPLFNLDKLP